MTTKTEIELKDGDYSSKSRLEFELRLPTTISSAMQKRLNDALEEIKVIYKAYATKEKAAK
jgi:hypothetical protein